MQYKTVAISENKYNADFLRQIRVYMKKAKIEKIIMSCPKNELPWWIYVIGKTEEDHNCFIEFANYMSFYLAEDLPDLFDFSDESIPNISYATDVRNVVDIWVRYVLTDDKLYEVI